MSKTNDLEVILVGDELLAGTQRDTHLEYLGRRFSRIGVAIARVHVIGDSVKNIASLITERLGETSVLVVTGGLGPTADDITRDGVARALGLELEFHGPSWKAIESFFVERGRGITENNRRQACFPRGAEVLPNRRGTAPGFAVEHEETLVFVLPGPPEELSSMVEAEVIPRAQKKLGREPLRVETFRTIGIGESKLTSLIGDDLAAVTAYKVSSLPSMTGVNIVLTQLHGADDPALLDTEADGIERVLRDTIGNKLYERGERTLAEVLGDLLAKRGETVAVAESLTGGMIGKQLTDVSGSSAYFLADVVSYSNESKMDYLGVREETLIEHGAVSEEVCGQMAHGVRRRTGATYGLATTGIAGPTGATPGKPIGLTYIGLAWEHGGKVKRIVYGGTRDGVRRRASAGVLWLLYNHLQEQKR
jgi:nicotinamide-nucleotide amidase